jgi:hypothetical protein
MKNITPHSFLRRTVCLVALIAAPMVYAQSKPAEPDTQEAFALQIEQQMLVGAVALHSICKERNPADAAKIDENLKMEMADMPPRAIAYSKTGAFKSRVNARKKEQTEDADAKTDAGIQLLKDMCARIVASVQK